MAPLNLKNTIRGLTFFTRKLSFFGGKQRNGDQYLFDQRGAVRITDKQITKRNGEVVKIRGVADAGNDSMVISRPGSTGQTIDPVRAMDAYHSWPYAAIKPIADEIAGIEWRLLKKKRKGENTDREEIDNHPLLDLLEAVNASQTGPEFRKTMAIHLELTGNAYILLLNKQGDPVNSETEIPAAIHLLDPSRVGIILNRVKYPYTVTGYTFTIDSRKLRFEKYQIVHVKEPDPTNPLIGKGTVQGIAEWIDNDNAATEFLKQFYENGAQIGVTFETEMTSEEQLHELRDSFNEQHSGVRNAYKAMFLPKGVKKPANDVKFDDVGFDETSDKNRDKILAGFRVPKTILGAAESDTNRATAETADYVFAKRTIKPKMIMICSYLNEFLVPRFGADLILSFTDPVPEDRTSKSNEMKNATGGVPVITPNEAREEFMDMEPIEGGDVMLTPNNFVPIEDAGKVPSTTLLSVRGKTNVREKNRARGKLGYDPKMTSRPTTQFAVNAEIRKSITSSLADSIIQIIAAAQKKSVMDMTDDEYEIAVLKGKRERAELEAKVISDELVKLNNQQKEEVLRKIDEAIKAFVGIDYNNPAVFPELTEKFVTQLKALDVSKLFDFDKWINLTISALTPTVTRIFKNEAEIALNVIDKPGLDIANTPAAKTAIDRAMNLLAQSYNQDTLDMLEKKLSEGLEAGMGVRELATLVQDIYAWKDKYAAERVALTESNRITNTAGKLAWKESGVVKEIKWVTLASDACPFCKDMNNETIPINQNFWNKDEVYEIGDETIKFDYASVGGPPLHPNCRCGIKPIISTTIES